MMSSGPFRRLRLMEHFAAFVQKHKIADFPFCIARSRSRGHPRSKAASARTEPAPTFRSQSAPIVSDLALEPN